MSRHLKTRDYALPLAILVAALSAVGYTGWRAVRAQRDTDLALRRMYATTAAAFLAERIDLTLAALADMAIPLPGNRAVDPPFIANAWRVADSIYRCKCTKLPRPVAAFAVAAEGVLVSGDSAHERATAQFVRALFAAGMPVSRRDSNLVLQAVVDGDHARLVMARVSPGPAPRRFIGLIADATSLDPRLLDYGEHAIADPAFFGSLASHDPRSVAFRTSWDSLLAFVVTTPEGQPFARTALMFDDGVLDAVLPARGRGFEVQAWTSQRAGPLLLRAIAPSRRGDVALVALLATVLIVGLFVLLLRAAALARMRQQLALGVTHELRTPLTQILLYAETLSMGRARTPAIQEKAAGVIVRETQFLIDAVDNVLHHTRAEQRELTTTLEVLECTEVVADALPSRAAKTVTHAIAPGVRVHADRRLLSRVVVNLVDNAMMHGGGHVTISSRPAGEMVELLFDDSGPGIPHRHRRHVFAPFFRTDDARSRPGFGIGLALVDEAVRAMGGSVHVDDAPGGGARLRVSLVAADGSS